MNATVYWLSPSVTGFWGFPNLQVGKSNVSSTVINKEENIISTKSEFFLLLLVINQEDNVLSIKEEVKILDINKGVELLSVKEDFVLLIDAEESSSALTQTSSFDASGSGDQSSGAAMADTRCHHEGAEGVGTIRGCYCQWSQSIGGVEGLDCLAGREEKCLFCM